MRILLLVLALLVAGATPSWAQSDNRWVAIFANGGTLNKGGDRYGDPGIYHGKNPHVITTMLERMGIPYKVILLPDSAGGWARQIGDTRDTDEADSTHFRKNGCMGWIAFMDNWSLNTSAKGYAGELVEVFTDANNHTGEQQGSPADGNWSIPGVCFVGSPVSGAGWSMGISAVYGVNGHARNRSMFANGDSLSTDTQRAFLPAAGEAANFTPIISTPQYATGDADSFPVAAWLYKPSGGSGAGVLYYGVTVDPYTDPKMLMLGLADLLDRAGYTPRRKLNLHIDADHIFPDSRPVGIPAAPSDSFFAYIDNQPWRFGGPIESHSSELADDDPVRKAQWLMRKNKFPSHPHSHNFLNFLYSNPFNLTIWDLSAFSDSATKRERWNFMSRAIADTVGATLNRGYEKTATFPNNDVTFPDLYIFASDGYRHIRSKAFVLGGVGRDSIGVPKGVNLRRWQQVPGPRMSASVPTYGLPYAYIEPKTNALLYVHDSVESPISNDSLSTGATDFSVSMEGFASRALSSMCRMAIWDGGLYWHPDLNLANQSNNGPLMAAIYRRFTYFYGRTKNILTVEPIYRPKTPRSGGTAR